MSNRIPSVTLENMRDIVTEELMSRLFNQNENNYLRNRDFRDFVTNEEQRQLYDIGERQEQLQTIIDEQQDILQNFNYGQRILDGFNEQNVRSDFDALSRHINELNNQMEILVEEENRMDIIVLLAIINRRIDQFNNSPNNFNRGGRKRKSIKRKKTSRRRKSRR